MFKTLRDNMPQDKDLTDRQKLVEALHRVLDGTLFDHLEYDFHTETAVNGEYIPVRSRRPNARYNLCRLVVDDSVSLLFSDGHFPAVQCENESTREALTTIIKEAKLPQVMTEAATLGSVGSVAIVLRILKNRVFFQAMRTKYLTPEFDPAAPDTLLRVTERYKVKGADLVAAGYDGIGEDDLASHYWFEREWNTYQEVFYQPRKVDEDAARIIDEARTLTHKLGFVPVAWIKNLPGQLPGGADYDGACTFWESIDDMITICYQLSQADRGLKYSMDPTLVVKEPAQGENGEIIKGAGNALVVSEDGDAKLLEISGNGITAALEYCRALRNLALEAVHGSRADADKLTAAQSGRAMELMHQSLIWLADKLRQSYGEGALLDLLHMVIKASSVVQLKTKRGQALPELSLENEVSLSWPAWFAPTLNDRLTMANAAKTHVDSGTLSRETVVQNVAHMYDVENPKQEMAQIETDMKAQAERDQTRMATISE